MKQRSTKPRKRSAPEGQAGGTQAIDRALAILKTLGGARADWGLTDLAAELGLHKTTVHRILGALEREGFVARDPERQTVSLGPGVIQLGIQARRSAGLHDAARPVLEALAAETGETATLEVLVGDAEVLILDEVHGRFILGGSPEVGTRWPAHAASTGKVLLAAARFEGGAGGAVGAARAGVAHGRLARLGPKTITSRERLERELAEVWRQGHAVGMEEVEAGFVAVGAPVRNPDGRTVAAISVGGPKARLGGARVPQLATLVRQAADRISARLGAPPPPAPDRPPSAGARPRRGVSRRS
jgi:DNA-binding IclR family transcriptional regulator